MEKNKKRGTRLGTAFLIISLLFLTLFSQSSGQTAWSVANLKKAKLTLSDSRPSFANTKHTAYFQATTTVPVSGKIIIDYPTQFNLTTSHEFGDMSMKYSVNADMSSPTTCSLAATAGAGTVGVSVSDADEKVTFTLAASGICSTIPQDNYVEITIGDGASGSLDDIANPIKAAAAGTADTYLVTYETQDSTSNTLDKATVRVAIIDAVTITAEVQATLSCVVAGVTSGVSFNTSPGGNTYGTAGFDTTATTIPFGILNAGTATQSGQLVKVSTNGSNGFYFAVKHYECNTETKKGTLCSSGGDDIDVFDDGTLQDNSAPMGWNAPAGTPGAEETYGHLGYGATDLTLDDLNGAGTGSRFTGAKFAGLSTTYEAVLSHSGPANGTGTDTNGQGYVVYKVEISGIQPAGLYSGTVSYLCTGRY
jgi:hypothetical protein